MGYENYLKRWIAPKWGTYPLTKIKPIEVEAWLRQVPLPRGSCARIRNIMSVLFNHARRYELYSENWSVSMNDGEVWDGSGSIDIRSFSCEL